MVVSEQWYGLDGWFGEGTGTAGGADVCTAPSPVGEGRHIVSVAGLGQNRLAAPFHLGEAPPKGVIWFLENCHPVNARFIERCYRSKGKKGPAWFRAGNFLSEGAVSFSQKLCLCADLEPPVCTWDVGQDSSRVHFPAVSLSMFRC